jgi:hypothetical protein
MRAANGRVLSSPCGNDSIDTAIGVLHAETRQRSIYGLGNPSRQGKQFRGPRRKRDDERARTDRCATPENSDFLGPECTCDPARPCDSAQNPSTTYSTCAAERPQANTAAI